MSVTPTYADPRARRRHAAIARHRAREAARPAPGPAPDPVFEIVAALGGFTVVENSGGAWADCADPTDPAEVAVALRGIGYRLNFRVGEMVAVLDRGGDR